MCREQVTQPSARFCGRETNLKRASATVGIMLRAFREFPATVADYTVGTVIVFVQLTLLGRGKGQVR